MGAYAPAPVPYDADELVATFVQPVLDHLAAAGTPYVGVLYAGLMLTADGPRLIEFNCRFGDPEAQAVLPLVESDLAELLLACTRGELAEAPLRVRDGAACTVVAAAPATRRRRSPGAEIARPRARSRTRRRSCSRLGWPTARVTGGRVLAVTGLGDDLAAARAAAYERMAAIRFDGMQVRRDIGGGRRRDAHVVRGDRRRHRRGQPRGPPDEAPSSARSAPTCCAASAASAA